MNIVKILIFNLNSFRDVLSFSSLGIELHILEPTAAAVSIPYITLRMFRGLDLKKKKRYGHSLLAKTSFTISGASFKLHISMSYFCKLRSLNLKKPSFAGSSPNCELCF